MGMASATQKTVQNSKTATPPGSTSSQTDTRLLNYVRSHAQQIVASISFAAARAGEAGRYDQMNEYLGMANQISNFCGLGQVSATVTGETRALAAGAGR
jgi:hypothetical protein